MVVSSKYPRTPHLPFSPGGTRDDRRLSDVASLIGVPVVITEKLDGSNLCLTREHVFARSHQAAPAHPSFDAAKALHAQIRWMVPENMSIFGEWCYAVHSITYDAGVPFFSVFGVRDDTTDTWLSWEEVEELAARLGVPTAPVLHKGTLMDERALRSLVEVLTSEKSNYGAEREGVVVRIAEAFTTDGFPTSVAKWVRPDHVQDNEHWSKGSFTRQPVK